MQGRSIDFLDDVLLAYEYSEAPASFSSINYSIGSVSYIENMEKRIFIMPYKLSFARNNSSYTELIRASLQNIAKRIDNDLNDGIRHNDFIQDHYADILKEAVGQLEKCGIRCSQIALKVEKLSWFVGGDPSKIKELQQNLNKLGIEGKSGKLLEDGVYGKETLSAWDSFLNKLVHGVVPILNWIDPLQSDLTGITIGSTTNAAKEGLSNALLLGKHRYIRFDPAPLVVKKSSYRGKRIDLNYNHINIDIADGLSWINDKIKIAYNHHKLSDNMYNILKDLKKIGKTVRIGGRILLIGGIVLDTLELGTSIGADLIDADKKLGKKTVSTVARIGGRWTGAIAGAKLGAMGGALTGPLGAPVLIPVLSIIGGVVGAIGGDTFAEWVVDITYVGE